MHQPLLLKSARIVDTISGEVHEPLDVLVSDARIQEISQNIRRDASGVHEYDCRGKWIIPGLFDCHTHLAVLTRQPLEVQKEIHNECELGKPFHEDKLDELVLSDFVRRGVTQVRDLGGPIDILTGMREKASRHQSAGPDIFFAGPMLEMPPLRGEPMNDRWPGWTVAVTSSADAEDMVKSLLRAGVKMIKVFGRFEKEVLNSLVSCAGQFDLPVTCDPGPTFFHDISVDSGIDSGIRCFEHAKSVWYTVLKDSLRNEHDELRGASPEVQKNFVQRLFDLGLDSISTSKLHALAEAMNESGTLLCPTLHIFKFYSEKPHVFSDAEPDKFGPIFAKLFEIGCLIVSELAKYEVRMLVGQDGYIPRFTHGEMVLLSQNGLSATEVLKGATCYPAEWLGISDKYGSIAAGKRANLVILNRNPLEDIRNVQSIHMVVRDGAIAFSSNQA
jgi:hypothetical protein